MKTIWRQSHNKRTIQKEHIANFVVRVRRKLQPKYSRSSRQPQEGKFILNQTKKAMYNLSWTIKFDFNNTLGEEF